MTVIVPNTQKSVSKKICPYISVTKGYHKAFTMTMQIRQVFWAIKVI